MNFISLIGWTVHIEASCEQRGNLTSHLIALCLGLTAGVTINNNATWVITCLIDQWQKQWRSGGLVS